jgi:hypothetical protein
MSEGKAKNLVEVMPVNPGRLLGPARGLLADAKSAWKSARDHCDNVVKEWVEIRKTLDKNYNVEVRKLARQLQIEQRVKGRKFFGLVPADPLPIEEAVKQVRCRQSIRELKEAVFGPPELESARRELHKARKEFDLWTEVVETLESADRLGADVKLEASILNLIVYAS